MNRVSKSKEFHKFCDNKGPTLTLIKINKNKIFGGFTTLDWKSEGGKIYDKSNSTFIFSLNLLKKYNMIDLNKEAIKCNEKYGPLFGNWDIGFEQDMKKGESYANINCNFLSNNNLELTGGKGNSEKFETEELDIYKVTF